MALKSVFLSSLLLLSCLSARAESGKIESIGSFTAANASDALKRVLEEKGARVLLSDGTVLCEIWMRKALPVQAKKEISGSAYSEIVDSAVVAVVSFPKTARDFRGQDIKSGAYTLRYAMHPTDGNHMGISPYRDFLLLTPIADDQSPDSRYKFEELTKMSAKTTSSNHPAAFSMVMAEGKEFPRLSVNDHEHLVYSASIKTSSGTDLPVAFVVKGVAEQ